ncbi:MAG TPA: DUF1015 family protein [Gemmatimonadales bacterium]|nr:DUF1015 family protein [Gemmatimonadales bacterium]
MAGPRTGRRNLLGGFIRLRAFRAWRPQPGYVARVASPPYDVVSRDEAAELAAGNPLSFLHVGRSDIDLPPDTDPHDPSVYAKARANLDLLLKEGIFTQEAEPALYLYELTMDGRSQIGVVGCVSVDDYARDVIKKHEKTRKDKEDDRTTHLLTLNAHAEPVFLTHQPTPFLTQLNAKVLAGEPLYDFVSPDGVRQRVWKVRDTMPYVDAFRRIGTGYVADGHHRSASAWRAAERLRAGNPKPTGNEEYEWFLAVLFPANQLRILPYNRVVKDLGGLSPAQFFEKLGAAGTLAPTDAPEPSSPGSFGVFVAGRWYRLTLDPASINQRDPIGSLDVSLLQERVLAPILGIGDVRTDPRIDFVGGIRGTAELERRVGSGQAAVAFAMYPVSVQQLMTISDAGQIMPPKSTWFEPKLKSGLFVHTLA